MLEFRLTAGGGKEIKTPSFHDPADLEVVRLLKGSGLLSGNDEAVHD